MNLRMAANSTARKLNQDGDQFLSGDGLPADSSQKSDYDGLRGTNRRWKGSLNGAGGTGRKTSRERGRKNGSITKIFRATGISTPSQEPDIQKSAPYTKPWHLVKPDSVEYEGFVDYDQQPITKLDPLDYKNRLKFDELKDTRLEAMCNWK